MTASTVKIKTEHKKDRARVGVQQEEFCERCGTVGAMQHTLQVLEQNTTLGHPLRFIVCRNETVCAERVAAREQQREQQRAKKFGPRPPARISDLYAD